MDMDFGKMAKMNIINHSVEKIADYRIFSQYISSIRKLWSMKRTDFESADDVNIFVEGVCGLAEYKHNFPSLLKVFYSYLDDSWKNEEVPEGVKTIKEETPKPVGIDFTVLTDIKEDQYLKCELNNNAISFLAFAKLMNTPVYVFSSFTELNDLRAIKIDRFFGEKDIPENLRVFLLPLGEYNELYNVGECNTAHDLITDIIVSYEYPPKAEEYLSVKAKKIYEVAAKTGIGTFISANNSIGQVANIFSSNTDTRLQTLVGINTSKKDQCQLTPHNNIEEVIFGESLMSKKVISAIYGKPGILKE